MDCRARLRLLLLSSHLNPLQETSLPTCFSTSSCRSDKETNRENDCVFCKIIRGEAPAFKGFAGRQVFLCSIEYKTRFFQLAGEQWSSRRPSDISFQTHIHIIPRKSQHDCLWASESLRRHPLKLDQEASQLADCIRENLSSLNECEGSKGLATSLIGN